MLSGFLWYIPQCLSITVCLQAVQSAPFCTTDNNLPTDYF